MSQSLLYFTTTQEGLLWVLFLVVAPVLFTVLSLDSIRSRHFKINAGIAIVSGVTAIALLKGAQGNDWGSAMLAIAGYGFAGLAAFFLTASISTAVVLLLRGHNASTARYRKRSVGPSKPSAPPMTTEYQHWKTASHRPGASYEEFLRGEHPRRFLPSIRVLVFAIITMVVVALLVLR